MSVLILKNASHEGPGTIEDFLRDNAIRYEIADLSLEDLPSTHGIDTLIMMGGPMSVNESDRFPYIADEISLARDCIQKGKKMLGVCLGAQIMARALGARVYPGDEPEIGWYDIELDDIGLTDPLMARLATHPRSGEVEKKFKVFHLHGETFDIPEGAVRIAGSELYQNQAFRYGKSAYAFQYHIEVRREMIFEWLKDEAVDMAALQNETDAFYDIYHDRAQHFYRGFFLKMV